MPRIEVILISISISILALLAGLYMPARILAEQQPSIMVYGLILFSIPAWLLGSVAAGRRQLIAHCHPGRVAECA